MKMFVAIFFILLFIQEYSIINNAKKLILSFRCEIKITIKEKGNHLIFNDNHNNNFELPTYLYINNISKAVNPGYYLNETINIIKLIWEYDIYNSNELFKGCSNISEIDLSNCLSPSINGMSSMFEGCTSLTSLNIKNFDTSRVNRMDYLFYNCISLSSLNLSNFNTNGVQKMQYMFYNCISLTSLNLSNFVTANSLYMDYMFYNCISLTSLNLSNFYTPQCQNMTEMFSNCSSLISVDFSNIDTNHYIVLDNMFKNCTKLNFINIKNFKIKEYNTIYERIFINTPINLVICAESSDINKIIETMDNCVSIDCSNDWKKNRKKINLENDTCIDSCDIINKYEYDGKCFDNPINSIQISDNNDDNLYIFCLKEKPYFFIDKGNCNSYCNLYDLKNNRCFIKYNNTEDNDNYVEI